MVSDIELLRIYMLGFDYELSHPKPHPKVVYDDEISQRAYDIGRADAIAGDDVSYFDAQSDEDILTNIKNIRK